MKNFLLASSALIVIAGAHPARAADQSAAPHLPTKTPIVPPAAIYNWTGCYVGAHGGGGAVSDTFIEGGGNFLHGGGGFAGGQIGCNYQDGGMVIGVEGEAWSGLTNSEHFGAGVGTENTIDRNRWSADTAVRAGLAFDRALLYGKAGVSEGQFDFFESENEIPVFNGGTNLTGLLLGLGMEYAFAPNWSAKLEYDHAGYLSRNVDSGSGSNNESATTDTVKAGVNYKFFGPSGAVVARD